MKNIKNYLPIVSLITFLSVFSFFWFQTTNTANAMVVRTGESYDLDSYATLEDDLYVLGETITVAGTTTGDIFAVGSYVEQSGTTSEDVFIAGGNVRILGEVKGDLRVVGGKVYISGHVTEDVIVGGGTVVIAKDAKIDGDLFVFADYFSFEGTVSGLVELHTRITEITGVVRESVSARAREAISLKGDAHIHGNFSYEAPRIAFISETAKVDGEMDYKESGVNSENKHMDVFGIMAYILVTVFCAVFLVYFFPAQTQTFVQDAFAERSGLHLFKGFVLVIAWPVLSVVLILTLIGSILGFVSLLMYGLVFLLSMMLAPVLSGVLLAKWLKKEDDMLKPAWASFGAIAFTLLAFVPILGFVMRTLLFLLSFYTVTMFLHGAIWKKRKLVEESIPSEKNSHESEAEKK